MWQWFEGNIGIFLLKVLSAFVAYVFIIEPVLFENLVNKDVYSFLDGHRKAHYLFGMLIIISAFFGGLLHGKKKKAFFSIIETTIVGILIYSHLLALIRYDLYPSDADIKYLNLLFIAPLISTITFIYCSKKKPEKINEGEKAEESIQLNQELPLKELIKNEQDLEKYDFLGYFPLAEVIFEAITSLLEVKRAFSIGINGTWGSGKSFLVDIITDILVEKYNKKKDKIQVIKFTPWLYPDEKALVSNFFIKWKEIIEKSSVELEHEFEKYAALLTNMELEVGGVSTKLFTSTSKDLEQIKHNITEHLNKSEFTYLIIIDDLDRLRKKEILEVAKLSRVLADFPRTIYLLAYDRGYIDSILEAKSSRKATNNLPNKVHTYFDKIIQLEFKIPQVTETNLAKYLEGRILDNNKFIAKSEKPNEDVKDLEKINNTIKDQLNFIKELGVYRQFLPTIRDIKRFVNGFLLKYRSLLKIFPTLSIKDLLLLDMLFYKYKESYEDFYPKGKDIEQFLSSFKRDKHTVNLSENFPTFKQLSSYEKTGVERVLNEIFKSKTPGQAAMLLDFYYSYFGQNKFTSNDLSHILIQPTEKQVGLMKDEINNENGYYLIKEYLERIKSDIRGNTLVSVVNDRLKLFQEMTNRAYLEAEKTLVDSYEEKLSTDVAELYIELMLLRRKENDSKKQNELGHCAQILTNFSVFKETLNIKKDEKKPKFKSQPVVNNESGFFLSVNAERDQMADFREIDDCYYPKVLNLSEHDYEIQFIPPQIPHWRFGFKFSRNNNFPLRAFRHDNYPCFHLGLDHDLRTGYDPNSIRVTGYTADRSMIIDNQFLNKDAFNAAKPIRLKLSYIDDAINFEIEHENKKDLNYSRLFNGYSKCMLFAWADAHKRNNGLPFEFEAEILEFAK